MSSPTHKRHHLMLSTALGPELIAFLQQANVLEIMLNPDGQLWLETLDNGKFFSGLTLAHDQAGNIIKLIANQYQCVVDEYNPELSCELTQFNARFQAWLPPIVTAPVFHIRKLALRIFSLEDYLQQGSIDEDQLEQLKHAVLSKKNILIAGGTGSGKTTFANALLHELRHSDERILILEDLAELQLAAPDHVHLRSSPEKTLRHLVKGALRMRPDRIIIGEVRDGGAALELLKAWNTGHPGGVCTIHANSANAALTRLEDLLLEVTASVPHRLIHEAINLVVFMNRDRHGQHRVRNIHTVQALQSQ